MWMRSEIFRKGGNVPQEALCDPVDDKNDHNAKQHLRQKSICIRASRSRMQPHGKIADLDALMHMLSDGGAAWHCGHFYRLPDHKGLPVEHYRPYGKFQTHPQSGNTSEDRTTLS